MLLPLQNAGEKGGKEEKKGRKEGFSKTLRPILNPLS
jgi:hypothetical protein